MSSRTVWVNGRFVPARRAALSIDDRGFLYGDALFETLRVDGGEPVDLDAHFDRLERAARQVRIPVPGDRETWRARIRELCRRNGLGTVRGAVRLTVTRGTGGGLLPAADLQPTVVLTARPLDAVLDRQRRRGIVVATAVRRGASIGLKAPGYLEAVAARISAGNRVDDVVFTSPRGSVLEGTASNVFAIDGGVVWTPPLRQGILPGTVRARVLAIARRLGLRTRTRALPLAALETAGEAFLTASTYGVLPIRRIDGARLPAPGPVTRRLSRSLEEELAQTIS